MQKNKVLLTATITAAVTILALIVGVLVYLTSNDFTFISNSFYLWIVLSITIITIITSSAVVIQTAREKQKETIVEKAKPVSIKVDIGGEPITLEVPDIETAEKILQVLQKQNLKGTKVDTEPTQNEVQREYPEPPESPEKTDDET